jgi:ABC-type long-subunit fatty acid transport system fused permease/ATPase subunit
MPLLDASDIEDPGYGLILIVMGLVVFIPIMFFLERRRRSGG